MAELFDWDIAADNNNQAPPDGFPEGMAPSAVNNAAREVMAVLARAYSAFGSFTQTNGSGNNFGITVSQTIPAYTDGMAFTFRSNRANTGSATLNVNGVGQVSMFDATGGNLPQNAIRAGSVHIAVFWGSSFRLINLAFTTGTEAFDLVQLTSAGNLPTLNGSALTNLNASSLATGTINNARYATNSNARGNRTVSTANPSGGNNGDIWYQYSTT